MKTFNVISSNPSNEGRTFVTKLYREDTVLTVFGNKARRETYYVSGSKQLATGSSVELELSEWNIVERPFEIEGNTIQCKWLHLGDNVPKGTVSAEKEEPAI